MAEERPYFRLAFVDTARGLAVLLMLQTHAYDAWLRPELRGTEFFRWSQLIGGLPGAFFLFLMGVSSALGNDRARGQGSPASALLRRGFGRAGLLLAVAFLFRWSMYLASDRPDINTVFRVDILNCLAASLALLTPLEVIVGRPRRILISIGSAVAFALATSFVWDGGMVGWLPEPLAGYLSGRVPNSTFPLFPWAAYAFAGHATGSWIAEGRGGTMGRVVIRLLGLALAGIPLALAFDRLDTRGPRYDYWSTSPNLVLVKTSVLLLMLLGCLLFEQLRQDGTMVLRKVLTSVSAALIQMGRTSLFIYCVHVDLVYGSRALPKLWRSCEITEASRHLVVLALAMLLLSYAWSWLKLRASTALAGTTRSRAAEMLKSG